METPVIFIHGLASNRREFIPIMHFLEKNGIKNYYEFTYVDRLGEIPLAEIAKKLAVFLSKVREKKVNIVAISQGGVIARYYLQNLRNKVVEKCITLCSPHHGSLMACLLHRPGIKDLRPWSKFLRELRENSDVKFYCVYTPFDGVVFPGWSGKLKGAKNFMVWAWMHQLAFVSPRTLRFIFNSLIE